MLAINHQDKAYVDASNLASERAGPFFAEIVPGCDPSWHAINTAPMEESIAAAHLVGRRFGVYVPTFEQVSIVRGKRIAKRRPLFPGHIFLFVWDIHRHLRRIRSCPGVVRVLTVDERPVVVEDEAIDRMQAIEFNGIDVELPKRRRKRKHRQFDVESAAPNEIVIRTRSFWTGVEALDDEGRVGVLHKALGLV